MQPLGQQTGHLPGRPALAGLDLLDRDHGAAHRPAQFILGQVERFTPTFNPFAEDDLRILLLFHPKNCSIFWDNSWVIQ